LKEGKKGLATLNYNRTILEVQDTKMIAEIGQATTLDLQYIFSNYLCFVNLTRSLIKE